MEINQQNVSSAQNGHDQPTNYHHKRNGSYDAQEDLNDRYRNDNYYGYQDKSEEPTVQRKNHNKNEEILGEFSEKQGNYDFKEKFTPNDYQTMEVKSKNQDFGFENKHKF